MKNPYEDDEDMEEHKNNTSNEEGNDIVYMDGDEFNQEIKAGKYMVQYK